MYMMYSIISSASHLADQDRFHDVMPSLRGAYLVGPIFCAYIYIHTHTTYDGILDLAQPHPNENHTKTGAMDELRSNSISYVRCNPGAQS